MGITFKIQGIERRGKGGTIHDFSLILFHILSPLPLLELFLQDLPVESPKCAPIVHSDRVKPGGQRGQLRLAHTQSGWDPKWGTRLP